MFDPSPNWYEGLPVESAHNRLREEEVPVWPDIPEAELVGWGWSLLVSDREEEIAERARDVAGFSWSAVGILDPEADPRLGVDDPRFGVILYAEDPIRWRGAQSEESDGPEPGARLEALRFEEIELPVIVRNARFELQRGPSSIGPGRAACWATSRGGKREGWLTARHVAEHSALHGHTVDQGRACVDAALVDVPRPGGKRLRRAVPPTDHSEVVLDFGHPVPGRVLDVATNCGIAGSSQFPLRFTVSRFGQPGDSGGLILAHPCGEPMGIYLGACQLESGGRGGFAQAITQLEYLMNLEVYL
jgi:hypothetical protein